jgi:alanine dehydrogenase
LMRTAAATALAARYLARPDARIVTICGCGAQARSQLQALADVRGLSRGFAWDMDQSRATEFAAEMSNMLRIRIDVPSSLDTATRQSDMIVTCTTAREPFLDESLVSAGTFIAAVGADAPAKNEIEPAFLAMASVFADVTVQAIVMGDLHHAIASGLTKADHIRGELADLVSGRVPGRTSDDEIIIFDSTGTAIEDVASAAVVYERALSADVLRVDLAST